MGTCGEYILGWIRINLMQMYIMALTCNKGYIISQFGKIYKNLPQEVKEMNSKVRCSVCGYPTDEDAVGQCPECNSYVCDECIDLYDSYCQDCYSRADEDY